MSKEATRKVLLRIAELKIEAHNLNDTPEEYIKKCQANTIKKFGGINMKFIIKYSYDKGKTILKSEIYNNGCAAVDFGHQIVKKGGIVYGLFCDGKRI